MNDDNPLNNGDKTVKRNEKGQIEKGSAPLNPAGKPKGAKHISTLVFNALQNMSPKGDGKKWEDLFVERILTEAIAKGNPKVMSLLWAYMDGQPQQGIDLTTGGESLNQGSEDVMEIAKQVAAQLKAKKTK